MSSTKSAAIILLTLTACGTEPRHTFSMRCRGPLADPTYDTYTYNQTVNASGEVWAYGAVINAMREMGVTSNYLAGEVGGNEGSVSFVADESLPFDGGYWILKSTDHKSVNIRYRDEGQQVEFRSAPGDCVIIGDAEE